MLDLHTHILPGVDDGAAGPAESLGMARAAVADGIELVAATPHVRDDYPTSAETMEALVGQLRALLAAEEVPLEVRPGGELDLERLSGLAEEEVRRFGLAGNPDYVLLEFPYYGWPLSLRARVSELVASRIRPVIAHPERNAEVQAAPELLGPLVEAGALVQVTAASVDGRLGSRPARAASRLLELGLAHMLASDAHAPHVRGIGLSGAAKALRDEDLARWMTVDVPSAIVAGGPLPARPLGRPRRFLGRI